MTSSVMDTTRGRTRGARPGRVGGAGRGRLRSPGRGWGGGPAAGAGGALGGPAPGHRRAPAASFPTQRAGGLAAALGPAFFDRAPLAGVGTPAVAEYAVEELAAALGLSHAAGLALVSEAVELRHRLPRLWALVQDGRLQAWKARQVARATTQLSRDAVAFVDRHLAVTGRHEPGPGPGPGDPRGPAAVRPRPGRRGRADRPGAPRGVAGPPGVHRHHPGTARLDTLDALDLDGTVTDLAGLLGRLGDPRDLDIRRATTLGMLAHPQRALDLATGERPHGDPVAGSAPERLASDSVPARHARRPGGQHRQQPDRAARHRLAGAAPGLAATDGRSVDPPGPRPNPQRRRRCARPAGLDARDGDAAGPALRVPRLHHRRPGLRPRPPPALRAPRRGRATRPDQPGEPGLPVPPAPPGQDLRRLAVPPAPRPTGDGPGDPGDWNPGPTYEWTSPNLRTYRVTVH